MRINLYAQDHTLFFPNRDSYGVLAANKNELAARAFERVSGGGAGQVLAPLPVNRAWDSA